MKTFTTPDLDLTLTPAAVAKMTPALADTAQIRCLAAESRATTVIAMEPILSTPSMTATDTKTRPTPVAIAQARGLAVGSRAAMFQMTGVLQPLSKTLSANYIIDRMPQLYERLFVSRRWGGMPHFYTTMAAEGVRKIPGRYERS